jgi:ketosteroid isomerase-like protein
MAESVESLARAFVDAINRHGVSGICDLMAPQHRFIDSLGNVVEGREKMRAGWTGYFGMVPDYTIKIEEVYGDGSDKSVVVMLGEARGTYAPDGKLQPENRWRTPAAFRALIDAGKVAEWRVYADNEPLRQCMARNKAGRTSVDAEESP